MEKWEHIKGCKDRYLVSNTGKVKSLISGKTLKQTPNSSGYLSVALFINGKQQTKTVHRLVALSFVPNPSKFPTVNHKDGNKANNHSSNLEWATRKENNRHGWESGLIQSRGEKHGRSKLTKQQVLQIRELLSKGKGQAELGRMFGVSPSTIGDIQHRRKWNHI